MGFEFWEKLRDLDAYPKPLEDFRIKTFGGGTVTVISTVIMVLLFVTELYDYVTPKVVEELFVDTSRAHKLRINIDIEFPRVACSYLSLDAMDSSGEHQMSVEHNVFKRRLDSMGVPLGEPEEAVTLGENKEKEDKKDKEELNDKLSNNTEISTGDSKKCGSCYGAENQLIRCCNSCEEVKEAYRLKGWALSNPESIEQCKGVVEDMKKIFEEGCQIHGYMEVNRVTGSFHIAPGKSFSISHVHVHDVQPYSSSQFNMTHRVRKLSFGEPVPGKMFTNPMDGVEGIAKQESMMFQYYLKIVPTMYEKLDFSMFYTNQFSTTRHAKGVSMMSGESGMPGVFFSYEISPIMIKFTEKRKSFGHFATSLCAIIGGIFTVAGLIDSTIYRSAKVLKKLEIGKQG